MMALTTVSRRDYEALLKDGELNVGAISERYGAGWMFRLQGILCAMAVRQCACDAEDQGVGCDSAEDLMSLVEMFHYDSIFEDNGFEDIKPGFATLNSMLFSMCEAETGDYGRDA